MVYKCYQCTLRRGEQIKGKARLETNRKGNVEMSAEEGCGRRRFFNPQQQPGMSQYKFTNKMKNVEQNQDFLPWAERGAH